MLIRPRVGNLGKVTTVMNEQGEQTESETGDDEALMILESKCAPIKIL